MYCFRRKASVAGCVNSNSQALPWRSFNSASSAARFHSAGEVVIQ